MNTEAEVPGDDYIDLFLCQERHPFIMVDRSVWEAVIRKLPEGYFIPDYRIINMISNMP
ncbi:hypothetical protein JCM10914A_01090 [Paenibacillus sp. JCM 10914]